MSGTQLPRFKSLSILNRPESKGAEIQLRLFCFAHAGGSPVVFNTRFAKCFPPSVQVIGITLPGRGSRFDEKPMEDVKLIVSSILDEISSLFVLPLFKPYIVYGHSFGACCALEMVRQLRRRGLTQPMRLFCSGRNPPQLGVIDPPVCHLPEDELQQQMLKRYDSPIITDEELKKLAIPPLRADLVALDAYLPDPYTESDPPLSVPLKVLVGEHDRMVPFDRLELWKVHTTSTFQRSKIEGVGHFFYENERFQQWLKRELEDALDEIDDKGELITRPHPEVIGGSPKEMELSSSSASSTSSSSSSSSHTTHPTNRFHAAPKRMGLRSISSSPSSTSPKETKKKPAEEMEEAFDLC
ncbi:putative Malonyl CoA-acyl carrier protein transacylase [Monocercomonoides exilis]|uniref:putative Malonyl CoA-acyl carrier protein transacylase n=1 Tax=Monocercomonoides exilis TaxID=2049356 RepID=UPI003559DDB8|nr:putative Malonyl CoA-acyl carrier protein transacylase [Monocercomonoides exilis]|eukprot:MONOS_12603.1-p1 / transcript=MONOS_12603.1 / gene=MONOS_12603 / organism=Monocercomonoides_exilis_PA203 / gene_product=putative thioesterase involved in non-ribosomal peptide biosynthesis / transcript_product=putative thioesterase involved in non-ribosomal peptide biosynthesis / location=Mono_scaffold00708:7623-8752(+) / protein_length=354 / sequence_SO=supercontig / SO=protein_coding / is_pseudo=false